MKQKLKVLFILENARQTEMCNPIREKLANCDVLAINTKKRCEATFQSLNFPYKTVEHFSARGIKNILKRELPDVIVVAHDWNTIPRAFVKVANSMRIPTLLIQDGILSKKRGIVDSSKVCLGFLLRLPLGVVRFIGNKNSSWRQKLEVLRLELKYGTKGGGGYPGRGECSKMAVFSNSMKEILILEGTDAERIVVTGNPKFDQIFHCKKLDCKQRICQEYGIPLASEIITLLTGPFVGVEKARGGWSLEQRERFISVIAEAVMALPNVELVIKVHPAENEAEYHEIGKRLGNLPLIVKDVALPELIVASSVVITVASTAALEAMAAGKPVIIVNLFGNPEPLFYKDSGAIYVDREEDILPSIKQALYDPQLREDMRKSTDRFVYEQAYLQDGQAARRIAELILDMTRTIGR